MGTRPHNGPHAFTRGTRSMMLTARGGVWDIGCWRFQRRWIDWLRATQVGGSLARDESPKSLPELVAGSERFFLRKFPKNLPFFFYQSLALGFDTM